MIKHFLFLVLLIISLGAYGQPSDVSICNCCSYTMLQMKDEFTDIYPPSIIKANSIKELTIYNISGQSKGLNDTVYKVVDKEYKEMIFRFNNDGYVQEQIVFNRRGQYNCIYEFTRDDKNRILTKTFYYLDSLGNKLVDFIPGRWNFTYSNNQLVKVKKLGNKFFELDDSKSDYNTYEYDGKDRIIKNIHYTYYDFTIPLNYLSITKYNDTSSTSINTISYDNKVFSTGKTKYSKSQKPLDIKIYDSANNKLLEEKIYTYNTSGLLTTYQDKSSGVTECPDGGNFTEKYSYSSLQLISHIRHKYKNVVCDMRFDYK